MKHRVAFDRDGLAELLFDRTYALAHTDDSGRRRKTIIGRA
jgi:hypothetical protein